MTVKNTILEMNT